MRGAQRDGERVIRVKDRLFVFLQILVVAARQPLHRREPAGKAADGAAALAARQLQRIRVFLLRHHAAAGRRRVGQLEEAVLVTREDDQVLGDAAQMHHRERDGKEKRRDEIAIRRRVDAVAHDTREAECARERRGVDRIARARDRAGAERHRVGFGARGLETIDVAAQRRCMGEKKMRDQHRLRTPQVRVRGHQRTACALRLIGACRNHLRQRLLQQRNAPAQVQPQVERHLLVARSTGVQSPARLADFFDELALDEAVDVFVGSRDIRGIAASLLENLLEPFPDRRRILLRQHTGGAERLGPGEAARHVVCKERAVEAEGDLEVERRWIGRRIETAGPESHERCAESTRCCPLKSSRQTVASEACEASAPSAW